MTNAKERACTILLGLAIIFKFWFIAGMEITDDVNDPLHYLEQILQHKGLCYGPGTGYVGRVLFQLGIPFRLGMEAAFLTASLLVIRALMGWPTRSFLALGVYLIVILNPAMEELLSHLMSDPVWLVEILIGISLFVLFTGTSAKTRWLYLSLGAISLGLSVVTRSTVVPLLTIFVIWAVAAVILFRLKAGRLPINFPIVGGGLVCLYAVVFFHYSVCSTNFRYNHFFGLSVFDSREYQRFYMCLQSVGEPTGDRYYPVDDDRLKLIAQAGPRSRWFIDQLAKDEAFRKVSFETYARPGIALCWFHWAVFETVDPDGDLTKPFDLFKEIESEIDQAGREKRLEVRFVMPLPDCRVKVVLSAVPDAFFHIAQLVRRQPPRYAWAWDPSEPRFDDPQFTRALNRRPVTPNPFRDRLGRFFCVIYSAFYVPLLPALSLAVATFAVCFTRRWREIPMLPTRFLAQQLFLVAFGVFFLWYLVFDASGLFAVPRYLVYNNVMLPVLLAYYVRSTWRLLREDFVDYSS